VSGINPVERKKVVVICLILAPLLFLLTAYLLGWLTDPVKATVAESIGTYRVTVPPHRTIPPGEVTLVVYEDGAWDYLIKDRQGQVTFSRTGKWKYHPVADRNIVFNDFELGFGRYKGWQPGFWSPLIQKNLRGVVEICFLPSEPVLTCLRKLGRPQRTGTEGAQHRLHCGVYMKIWKRRQGPTGSGLEIRANRSRG
jgi:hypothetical protein